MRSKGLFALGACTAATLAAPAAASALDLQGATANTTASVTQIVGSVQETVGTTLQSTTSSATPSSTSSPETSSSGPTSSSSESGASTREASSASSDSEPQVELQTVTVQGSTTEAVGWRPKAKKARAKRCARAAAGPNDGGPPAAGCTRIDGSQVNGTHQIVVNGVTITFTFTVTDTPQGPVLTWTSDVPYSGTIFVKGGPDFPGFACTYDTPTTSDSSGNCHAPVNQGNGKYYGVSHIDVCPPGTTTEPPSTTSNPPGTNTQGEQPKDQKHGILGKEQKGTKGAETQGTSPVAAASASSSGDQLPFTGANLLWLVAIACALTGSGLVLRGLRA